jgi:hypothetical protein
MRPFALFAILSSCAVLAGCSSPATEPPAGTTAAAPLPPPEPIVLAEGTYKWHDHGTTPLGVVQTVYSMGTQTATHPCVWEGQPFFSDLPLPTQPGAPGPGNLSIELDWTVADYAGDTLVVAYRAPGDDYRETRPIGRATPTSEPVAAPQDAADAEDDAGDWGLALCLANGNAYPSDPGYAPAVFAGSVQVRIAFTPDAAPPATPATGASVRSL